MPAGPDPPAETVPQDKPPARLRPPLSLDTRRRHQRMPAGNGTSSVPGSHTAPRLFPWSLLAGKAGEGASLRSPAPSSPLSEPARLLPLLQPTGLGQPPSHHDVPPAMQGQVVGAGEAAVTVRAAEGLDARVLPEVPGQLVRASKLPGAALPGALVGLLSCRGNRRKGSGTRKVSSRGPCGPFRKNQWRHGAYWTPF